MKFIYFLRKIGVVRGGGKGSAEDRPVEAVMDDAYTAKKDSVDKSNTKRIKREIEKAPKNRRRLFVVLAIGILTLLFSLLAIGFSFWFFVSLFLWGGFFFWFKKTSARVNFSFFKMLAISLGLIFVTFVFMGLGVPNETSNTSSGDLKKYDGRVLNISSENGNLKGLAELTYRKMGDSDYLMVDYLILINDKLKENGKCLPRDHPQYRTGCNGRIVYEYTNNLITDDVNSGEGSLNAVYCNKDEFPDLDETENLYNFYGGKACGLEGEYPATKNFFATFSISFESYEDILNTNIFELYDSSDSWVITSKEGGVENSLISSSIDDDASVAEGEKVRDYRLLFDDSDEDVAEIEVGTEPTKTEAVLAQLRKETGLEFSEMANREFLWNTEKVGLKLNEGRSFDLEQAGEEDRARIEKFFESTLNWSHGTIGFVFASPLGEKKIGYASTSMEDNYKGIMCVVEYTQEDLIAVMCGLGPGG